MSQEKQFKIVLLGEGRVGKTSLVLRYCKGAFDEKQGSTMNASYMAKRINIDNQRVNLDVWDTAGQERFHALGPIYYRDSNGALLVYDITDNDSFARVQMWVKELRKMLGKDVVLTIAGNKCDLERSRVVPLDQAEAYAASVGAKHFTVSAKLNKNVNEVFLDLTQRMLKTSEGNVAPKVKGGIGFADEPIQKDTGCAC